MSIIYQIKKTLKDRPLLKCIVHNLKVFDTWKIQLAVAINFTFYKANDEERVLHNIEIMINEKAD